MNGARAGNGVERAVERAVSRYLDVGAGGQGPLQMCSPLWNCPKTLAKNETEREHEPALMGQRERPNLTVEL